MNLKNTHQERMTVIMDTGIATKCIYGNHEKFEGDRTGAISFPIYQTATYAHPAVGQSTGYDYSRLQNPTREQLEKIVASLEGGLDALAFSSGMAAITTLMEIFKPGDHIISEADLYGGPYQSEKWYRVQPDQFCRGRSGKLHKGKYKSNLYRDTDQSYDECY